MPLLQTGPDLLAVTAVLACPGLAAALVLAAVSLWRLFRVRQTGALLDLGVAVLFLAALGRVLARCAQGTVCYRPLSHTLLLYGGILAVLLYFIREGWRALHRTSPTPQGGKGGGGA